jgi:molybdate transport system substrate-binding protein
VKRFRLALIWAVAVALGPKACAQAKREVVVAAAANLSEAFRALGPKFEAATGIHPVFSFESTAQLASQVQRGAPFDVFAAADSEHVQTLTSEGLLQSRSVFARGVLALWFPGGEGSLISLTDAKVRVIAMAKPELAPYGAAAVEALQRSGMWEQVKRKVVYAENVSMAKQYGESGNADAVLTAYSLMARVHGTVLRIDPKLYRPLDHEVGVVAAAKNSGEAKAFVSFLLSRGGREVLQEFGYQAPPAR